MLLFFKLVLTYGQLDNTFRSEHPAVSWKNYSTETLAQFNNVSD